MFFKRLAIILFILLALLIPTSVLAVNQFNNGNNIVLNKDETMDKDYFATGDNITISGTVNGDVYVAGGNILVEGTINGDLLAAGGIINVRGTVNGNIRTLGGEITVSGPVSRNATLVGGNINLTDSAKIENSLVVAGGNVAVLAPVSKDISAATGQLNIGNTVGGDVNAAVGQIILSPSANIAGDLNYWSQTPANIQSGAIVSGQTNQFRPPEQSQQPAQDFAKILAGLATALKIISLISLFILGSLLLFFLPISTEKIISTANQKPWVSLGIGVLAAILIPILIFILIIFVVTFPLALLLLGIFLILWYIAKIFIIIWLGQKILGLFQNNHSTYLALLIGIIAYGLLTLIPLFGGLIGLIITFLGLGAILLEQQNYYRDLRSKKLI